MINLQDSMLQDPVMSNLWPPDHQSDAEQTVPPRLAVQHGTKISDVSIHLTTLRANWADDILELFFFVFPRKMAFHEMSRPIFCK